MHRSVNDSVPERGAQPASDAPRAPYAAPVLSKLGSIHELTLGTSNKLSEGNLRNL